MATSLDNSRIKLNRAKRHLSDLKTQITDYLDRKPFRIYEDTTTEPGERLIRFEFVEEIPEEFGAVIGDVIHNLRAALDNLAVDLVRANGVTSRSAIRSTYFPISIDKSEFEDAIKSKFRRTSNKAKRIIRLLKPYKNGTIAFWQLHQLDILDKHTNIVPVGVGFGKMLFDVQNVLDTLPEEFFHGDTERFNVKPVWLDYERKYPLENQQVIMKALKPVVSQIWVAGKQVKAPPPPSPKIAFQLELAFGEGQILDGEAIVPTLTRSVDFVERVIAIFERYGP